MNMNSVAENFYIRPPSKSNMKGLAKIKARRSKALEPLRHRAHRDNYENTIERPFFLCVLSGSVVKAFFMKQNPHFTVRYRIDRIKPIIKVLI